MAAARPLIIIEEGVVIPATAARDFDGFREWAMSDDFPRSGRIDYLQGTIEVNLGPEELQTHGFPKNVLNIYIGGIVLAQDLGQIFVDCTRFIHPAVGLSCEPDIIFIATEALQSERVRYVQSMTEKMMEVEGSPTLVVEVVGDSSVQKDLKRLPRLYAQAGVEELWLVDARGPELFFEIRHLHEGDWRLATADADGFRESRVLGRRLRFRREPWKIERTWRYFVEECQGSPEKIHAAIA
jgi:Uma2 family endonuclease